MFIDNNNLALTFPCALLPGRRKLCAKLFLIMGITWVAELLSYLIGDSPVWYFFDVINILQVSGCPWMVRSGVPAGKSTTVFLAWY